jgi:hypothetical protein
VDGLENSVLLQVWKVDEVGVIACLRFFVDGDLGQAVGFGISWHVLVAITDAAVIVEAFVDAFEDGDAAFGGAISLGEDVFEDDAPEAD